MWGVLLQLRPVHLRVGLPVGEEVLPPEVDLRLEYVLPQRRDHLDHGAAGDGNNL